MKSVRNALFSLAVLAGRCALATKRHERADVRPDSPKAAVVLLLPVLLFAAGCASMLTGTHETITVDSTPAAARASLFCGNKSVGEAPTPAKFTISRDAGDCTVTVRKTGYLEQRASIEQHINPAYWMNIVAAPAAAVAAWNNSWWGFLAGNAAPLYAIGAGGFLADACTGAMHTHRPRHVRLALHEESE
jgi:hypothetical protein